MSRVKLQEIRLYKKPLKDRNDPPIEGVDYAVIFRVTMPKAIIGGLGLSKGDIFDVTIKSANPPRIELTRIEKD